MVIGIALTGYLLALFLFTFFPRPILESGDSSAIAEFLKSHSSFFYKILYADTRSVAIGNFFMLTPFPILLHAFNARLKSVQVIFTGFALTLLIEFVQRFIPGRVSDPKDIFANAISVVIGQVLVLLWMVIFDSPRAKTD